MTARTSTSNVRSADVLRSAATDDDAGSRTLRRGLQLLDAVLAGGRDGVRVVDLCRVAACLCCSVL